MFSDIDIYASWPAWGLHALSLNYRLINPRRSVINPRRFVINPLTSYRAVLYNKVNFFQN